jgi:uncharacterized protein YjbJ (UPF0337 family)
MDARPARRLRRLPRTVVLGRNVPVARGLRARLLGLALLKRECAGPGLLISGCASVHTWGMRFKLDVLFLDADGQALRTVAGLGRCRVARCPAAVAVLELPARDESPRFAGLRSGNQSGQTGRSQMSLIDKITGRFKKTAGDVTDDPSLRRKGAREEQKGERKEELSRAQDRVENKAQEVGDLERKT